MHAANLCLITIIPYYYPNSLGVIPEYRSSNKTLISLVIIPTTTTKKLKKKFETEHHRLLSKEINKDSKRSKNNSNERVSNDKMKDYNQH